MRLRLLSVPVLWLCLACSPSPGNQASDLGPADSREQDLNPLQDTGSETRNPDLRDSAADLAAPDLEVVDELEADGLPGDWTPGFKLKAPRFTLETLDGAVSSESLLQDGGQLIFIIHDPRFQFTEAFWTSSVADMLDSSPPNVEYLFLSLAEDPSQDVAARRDAVLTEMDAALTPDKAAYWPAHLHFVTELPAPESSWIWRLVMSRQKEQPETLKDIFLAFAVDSKGMIRQTGMLLDPGSSDSLPELRFLVHEVRYLNFEARRESEAPESAVLVPLFAEDQPSNPGDTFVEVTLPALEDFNTVSLDLALDCPDNDDANCGEWDYLAELYLCAEDNADQCDVEVARWVTTYGREGRWITNLPHLLPLLGTRETARFRFRCDYSYRIRGDLVFSHEPGPRPFEAIPLFSGGTFDQSYNDGREPIEFFVPPTATSASLVAIITGHGWGWDKANCAEFCNHTHHFTVNSREFIKEHPQAGSPRGCANAIEQGVVPNQYGTWPYGRGGWCPGLDVAPWTRDVTEALVSGANVVEYRGLFQGKDYQPVPRDQAQPNSFPGNIRMTSWLVFSR